jgi:glycosyltransferase involved in cell wall biosynthesis
MVKGPIVFVFNSPLSSGCDYVMQTIRLISKRDPTFGIALGDIIGLKQLLFDKNIWFFKTLEGATIIRPVSILPGLRFRIVRNISYAITCIFLRLALTVLYLGKKKTLWFFEPFHVAELFWIFVGYQTVYDCVDYYIAFSPYAKTGHNTLARCSTFVFANSETLQDKLKEIRPDVIHVPLGFSEEIFASVTKNKTTNKIFTVGYVGSISARLDFRLLIKTVQFMPNVRFLFVGPYEKDVFGNSDNTIDDFGKLLSFPNVEWVKEIPKHKIPRMIACFDACMIPYDSENIFNMYSFPMKTMEYLYMQKPTVSTHIKEIAKLGVIRIISTPKQFVQFVRDVRLGKWTKDDKKLERRIALQNTWEKKIQVIISKISFATRGL